MVVQNKVLVLDSPPQGRMKETNNVSILNIGIFCTVSLHVWDDKHGMCIEMNINPHSIELYTSIQGKTCPQCFQKKKT